MRRKLFSVLALAAVLVVGTSNKAAAQKGTEYSNAVGMRLDVGDGGTLVGISGKHMFNSNNGGEAQLLFGSGRIVLGAEYQYHGDIPNAAGLKWVAGFGPAIVFNKKSTYYGGWGYYYTGGGGTDILLRPSVGLDYKINNVPLNFSFDWRPAFQVTHGTEFTAARFGIGARFAF